MGKQFGGKWRFKRLKATNKMPGVDRPAKKSRHLEKEVVDSPSPSSSEVSLEEQATGETSEEEVVCKEPSTYDYLLTTLQASSKSAVDELDKSEGDDSEADEDEDDDSESISMEDDGNSEEEPGTGTVKQTEDDESDDNTVLSDEDQEKDLVVNGQTDSETLVPMSAFHRHLEHELSLGDVQKLSSMKCKYIWETPAAGMPNCKWKGTGECFLNDSAENSSPYDLKGSLYEHWSDLYKKSGGKDFHSSKERSFFSLCNSYRDILQCDKKPFYLKGHEDSRIMDAYLIHSLNHILKTRELVRKNDTVKSQAAENSSAESFHDQGFTRPKILILLPLAIIMLRVIKRLVELAPSKYKIVKEHLDRLDEKFGTQDVGNNGDNNGSIQHSTNSKFHETSKPSDYEALFGGNFSDCFMIGIKFTRNSIKLFNDFYSSDMIVASPLGLVTKIAAAEKNKEKDVDYLSSIEVFIIDHADIIAMQNWSHVTTAVEEVNKKPSKTLRTDLMRIRSLYTNLHARFYRQSIILGCHLYPDINALFNRHCCNYEGKVRLVCEYKGVLPKVMLSVKQIYELIDADSIVDVDNARLEFFTKKVFPKIKESIQGGIMLFVSSYFEFVRLRNFLKSQKASFCLLGEYTKESDISRARVWFFQGQRKIMLYTERAHFFKRYKIRGIKNLIIYSLPERKEFYPEILNMLDGSESMSCTVLFSRFDQLRLERIVGTSAAKKMVSSEKSVFVFC